MSNTKKMSNSEYLQEVLKVVRVNNGVWPKAGRKTIEVDQTPFMAGESLVTIHRSDFEYAAGYLISSQEKSGNSEKSDPDIVSVALLYNKREAGKSINVVTCCIVPYVEGDDEFSLKAHAERYVYEHPKLSEQTKGCNVVGWHMATLSEGVFCDELHDSCDE